MGRPLFLLLLACAAARGGVLELTKPSDDWDTVSPGAGQTTLKAHLRTPLAEGRGSADVYLFVSKTTTPLARHVTEWAAGLAKQMKTKPVVSDGTLGGAACRVVDARNEAGHATSWLVRRGDVLINLHVVRAGAAAGYEDIEAEIERIRGALQLPPAEAPKPKPGEPEAAPKPAEPSPRAEIKLPFWRLELVKPRGFARAAELDASEKANGVVVKLTAAGAQRRCWIRVYARSKKQAGRADKLLEKRRAHLLTLYDGKPHEDLDLPKWKPPLAKRVHRFGLVGKRKVAETWRWYVVDGRNDRQYEVEIFTTGAWNAEIADFLEHFRPVRGR